MRRVDPDGLREEFWLRFTGDEAFRTSGAGLAQHDLPASDDLIGLTEVDLFRGQHRDAAVPVFGQDSLCKAIKDDSFAVPQGFAARRAGIVSVLRKLAGCLEVKNAAERQTVLDSAEFKAL